MEEIFDAGEGLVFGGSGDRGFGEMEDVGGDQAGGAGGEDPVMVGGSCHGEEDSRRGEGWGGIWMGDEEPRDKTEDSSARAEALRVFV